MTDITRILSRTFLEFLGSGITDLCSGKVSVVFEDLQSIPICQRYPRRRVFAGRGNENICEQMIDCPENRKGQEKCKASDQAAALVSRNTKKGFLYRCNRGKGFPNFLFPIIILQSEVVGFLYVGQFAFKKLSGREKKRFLRRLEDLQSSGRYIIDNAEQFISGWSGDSEIQGFYDEITEDKKFSYEQFKSLLNNQVREYGISEENFFSIIEFIEELAQRLSNLGNALYTLESFVEMERYLPPTLSAKYESEISEVRNDIMSLVADDGKRNVNVVQIAQRVSEKSLDILIDLRDYEDKYVAALMNPFKLGAVNADEKTQLLILEFCLAFLGFAISLYSKVRPQRVSKREEELASMAFESIASCGLQFDALREVVKNALLKLYQDEHVRVLIRPKLVQTLRVLFRDDSDDIKLTKCLVDNGLTEIRPREYSGTVQCFPKSFDTLIRDFEIVSEGFNSHSEQLISGMNGDARRKLFEIGDIGEYIHIVHRLRLKLSDRLSSDKFGTRKALDLKAYEVWLNSGGLNSIHKDALQAQQKWLAQRNESGPIGPLVEQELGNKVENIRSAVANFVGAGSPDCIIFTSNTTMSIDEVLRAVLTPGAEVLMTDLEHDVVKNAKDWFYRHFRIEFKTVPLVQYQSKQKDLIKSFIEGITAKTRVVIISHVAFNTGSILPLEQMIKQCKDRSKKLGGHALILVDGAHAVGNIEVQIGDIGCDFYAFDGHKWLLGPEGTGVLYSKEIYLDAGNAYGVHFYFPTAYMVSPKYSPRNNGDKYELGTADVSKIIGLGAVVEAASGLKPKAVAKHRESLVLRMSQLLATTDWRILNLENAVITGMLMLQISGHEHDPEIYEKLTADLDGLNVKVRALKNPSCIRICLHHINNETDVDIAAFHLKALLEGTNVHRGDPNQIKERMKQMMEQIIKPVSRRDPSPKIGLSIFSIAGSGKTTKITEMINELLETRIIKAKYVLRHLDFIGNTTNAASAFSSIFKEAWKKENQPALIFIDEADKLLTETKENEKILGVFNDELKGILDKRRKDGITPIVFVTAENDPYKIAQSAARRLHLGYYPLPDTEARLSKLIELSKSSQRKCSNRLLLRQIAGYTDGYSMSDLEAFWSLTLNKAKNEELTPDDFLKTLETFKANAKDKNALNRYNQILSDLRPIKFTGAFTAVP
jgi:L-cysteine/cystine lyase